MIDDGEDEKSRLTESAFFGVIRFQVRGRSVGNEEGTLVGNS